MFRPATVAGLPGTPTALPPIVNRDDESLPAFTPDSRYVGFVRRYKDRDRLFLWDSQTQTLLNGNGIDLGGVAFGDVGNLSLYFRPTFTLTNIRQGIVTANLAVASGVGLFVQRITGRRRVLGRGPSSSARSAACRSARSRRAAVRKRWDSA